MGVVFMENIEKDLELNDYLVPFLADAFSTNKKTYDDVNKIYNLDKVKFIDLAKQDTYYNSIICESSNIEEEYYFKKTLGLICEAKKNNSIKDEIITICKKCWKYAFTFIKENETIKLSVYLNKLMKKYNGVSNFNEIDIHSNLTVVLFLAQNLNKTIDRTDEQYLKRINYYKLRLNFFENKTNVNIDKLSKDNLKKLRQLELKIINDKKIEFIPLKYNLTNDYDLNYNTGISIYKLSKQEKYFIAFEDIFDIDGVSLINIVKNNYLKSKDIQQLIYLYINWFEENEEIDFDEIRKYLYPAIQIRYLCREYKKAKKYFFDNFTEELHNQVEKFDKENKEIIKNNLLLTDENNKLKLQIEEMKRDSKRLTQELSEANTNKIELVALREFIFNLNTKIPVEINNINYTVINEFKGIIIGGYNSWQTKMKELLSEWTFISVDTSNFDENILKNNNHIFINASCMSHGMYYRVMKVICSTNNKKIHFINNQNTEICIEKIHNQIKKDK